MTAVVGDLEATHPLFRGALRALDARARELGFRLYETHRTPARQDRLKDRGVSMLGGASPLASHVRGAAADFVLEDPPPGRSPWFTGVDNGEVEDGGILSRWHTLGAEGKRLSLVWGGDWGRDAGRVIGWDPYHFQLAPSVVRGLPAVDDPEELRAMDSGSGLGGLVALAILLGG